MISYRLLIAVPLALVMSGCALVQPIYRRTPINDADDCITTESQVIAPTTTALEAAVGYVMRRCDIEIHAAEQSYLAQSQGNELSTGSKIADLRRAQRDLARHLISQARAI